MVRAGLVPALRRGGRVHPDGPSLCPGVRWQLHVLTSSSHLLQALASSLTRATELVTAAATLLDDLRTDARSLQLWVRRHLGLAQRGASQRDGERLLLVIDQFEELFTQCDDDAQRQALIDNLLTATAAADSSTHVVLTLRADFYQHLAPYPALSAEIAEQQIYIGAMTTEELRQAIELPALRGGWQFCPAWWTCRFTISAPPRGTSRSQALCRCCRTLCWRPGSGAGDRMNLKAYSASAGCAAPLPAQLRASFNMN